jgi:transposase
MSSAKYIGLDVHQATTVAAVLDGNGKLVMEAIVETKAATLLQFIDGISGELHVTLEEGTCAAWLHDLLLPHVTQVIVCDPRKNALLKHGNKSDKVDARKLAELLRTNLLSPVYHGQTGVNALREVARSYLALTQDTTRVMNRIKAVYHGRGLACPGQKVYSARHRSEWLEKLSEPSRRRRAERLHEQLDALERLRKQARHDLLQESRKHQATAWLRQIPWIGAIRAALLVALMQTPHRFRTKRQLWAYSGFGLETRDSAEYRIAQGQLQRRRKGVTVRGLNHSRNRDLKELFKSTAISASTRPGPFADYYTGLLQKGLRPAMARLTLARKIAAIVLAVWKKGERFDPTRLTSQAA